MKNLINNQNKIVTVTEAIFNELKNDFKCGVWCVIIKDTNDNIHSIILNENF